MGNVLITGVTGFLGTEIAAQLMTGTGDRVFALVRAKSVQEAERTLSALWWERPELHQNLGERIVPVLGDITQPGLGLDDLDGKRLIGDTDTIIHCAAEVGINQSRANLWAVNVQGTGHVLAFAMQVQADHPLHRFSHISTAYVAGTRRGHIGEDSLVDEGFGSLYEQSKFEAEKLVLQHRERIPVSIFRPGQIVGHSETGRVKTFNTLYYPLKLYLKNQLNLFPMRKRVKVNMVPVDYVAEAVVRITCAADGAGLTFHLTAPAAMQPTVHELVGAVRVWAGENLQVKRRAPLFLPLPFLGRLGARRNLGDGEQKRRGTLSNLLALAPYFTEKRTYDTANTERFMGPYSLDWRAYLPRLLAYATSKNFLNHNSRTVFEQMQVRLTSKRAPITYYDVAADGIHESSGDEVRGRIERALKSLCAMGISGGSRVAITGINSVDYFVLDAAIGLSGASSVPLYYTTPVAEIDPLLEKSGARWLFIGDPRILAQIGRLEADVRLVSFVHADTLPEDPRLMSLEQFLALGEGVEARPGPAQYGDTATIRCTSGTTGNSKGVMFNHYQLRWMGEALASLLSWKSRCTDMCYLSFLPMSHVVEGILGAYTPYYLLSPISLYYLNDFDKLAETLPQVRPTIFFSVPRFYEKLWVQFTQSGAGKFYLTRKPGFIRNVIRGTMRRGLLKRAGLDRCDQLIVGSAPVSEQLLSDFRELGIEVHNAYGLTEAPLITLNRLGDNALTTAGVPLPDTQVEIAEDGEILVRGPQVSVGYDGETGPALPGDGLLHTGDLGVLTDSGHLQIIGRKKEILITAYGKNINLQKIETKLKDIPGVSEAMLVGENRPYCVALIWLDEDGSPPDEKGLAEAISAMNADLSNPEKVKRWAVISTPLKISAGELTPNLKLRRESILTHHAQAIEGLYAPEIAQAGQSLYVGAVQ